MKNTIIGVMCAIVVCVVIYAVYWVFKSVSYDLFYESMVQDTINEVLKVNNLIN